MKEKRNINIHTQSENGCQKRKNGWEMRKKQMGIEKNKFKKREMDVKREK